jgi:ER lumen protein retaining receptor
MFSLGIVRFFTYAHWVLQVLDSHGYLLIALGHGLWTSMVLLIEIVQTFMLADLSLKVL